MRSLTLIFTTVIALFFIAFAAVNRDSVTLSFFPLPYSADMPKFLLAILCFAIGAMIAGLIASLKALKIRHLYAQEHKRVMALENEIEGMQMERTVIPGLSGDLEPHAKAAHLAQDPRMKRG